jgi:hypothetical protein
MTGTFGATASLLYSATVKPGARALVKSELFVEHKFHN